MPDGDGLELIRELSVANPNAVALVLSPSSATDIGIGEVIDAVKGSAGAEE